MKKIILILIFIIVQGCKEKPKNLLNRIGGDAHLVENNSFEFKDSISIFNYNKGTEYLRSENLKKAKIYFLKSLEREPNNTTILNALGSIDADFGNFKESYEYFEKSLKLKERNTLTYMSYGVALNKSIYQDKAIEIWKKGLEIELNYEKTGYFNYNIANAFYKLEKYKESKEYNDKALKIISDKEVIKDVAELEKALNELLK